MASNVAPCASLEFPREVLPFGQDDGLALREVLPFGQDDGGQ